MTIKHPETIPALWRCLLLAAILSFIPSLFFNYVGEEGVYTITTLEMWHNHQWWSPVLYGNAYGRPPFLNWIMLPFAFLMGPQHILVASRLVTAIATVLTGAALFAMCKGIGASRRQAWLALLVFLSSDALLYHGWLAYSDPLFALLTFGAMACILCAARRNTVIPLAAASVLVTAAFLTKALTAYIFVCSTWVIVFARHREARAVLLKPAAFFCYAAAFAAPLAWLSLNNSAGLAGSEGGAMTADIVNRMAPANAYALLEHLVAFPLETAMRFLPVSAIALYSLLRKRAVSASELDRWNTSVTIIVLVNFLPYWLAPQGSIRYILPLYPLIAWLIASRLSAESLGITRIAVYSIITVVALKFVAIWIFPGIQNRQKGDAAAAATDIVSITGRDDPIYTDDPSSAGLSIAGNVDSYRWPARPVTWIPAGAPDGWILTRIASRPGTEVMRSVVLGKEKMYLLCSGKTCSSAAARANRPAIVDASTRSPDRSTTR